MSDQREFKGVWIPREIGNAGKEKWHIVPWYASILYSDEVSQETVEPLM